MGTGPTETDAGEAHGQWSHYYRKQVDIASQNLGRCTVALFKSACMVHREFLPTISF
jgi:hypothetical protein